MVPSVLENKRGGAEYRTKKKKIQHMEVKFALKSRILPITTALGISDTREKGRWEVG
jgi:hypothetical protein